MLEKLITNFKKSLPEPLRKKLGVAEEEEQVEEQEEEVEESAVSYTHLTLPTKASV